MSDGRSKTERDELKKLAKQYERDGYRFVTEPAPAELPSILRSYTPDALAVKGDEHIVIEIASSAAQKHQQLKDMAEQLEDLPGWKLAVVWVSPESEDQAVPTPSEVRKGLKRASALLSDHNDSSAALYLWSVFEAAARLKLRQSGEDVRSSRVAPDSVLRMLTYHGVLTQEEYERLREILQMRNAIAHGGFSSSLPRNAARYLLKIAARFVEDGSEKPEKRQRKRAAAGA